MSLYNSINTPSYTTSTTNMYDGKDFTYRLDLKPFQDAFVRGGQVPKDDVALEGMGQRTQRRGWFGSGAHHECHQTFAVDRRHHHLVHGLFMGRDALYLVGNAHHQPFNARVAVAVVPNLFRSVFHGAFGVGVGDKTKLVPTDDFHFAFLRRRARAVKDLLADLVQVDIVLAAVHDGGF